ncbi:MAG TPA: hypothetical protein PKV50_05505 [Prolixibacteraceae bacterium]|nr:hypothetical protein [Prolixibacteraceae bacterium]
MKKQRGKLKNKASNGTPANKRKTEMQKEREQIQAKIEKRIDFTIFVS